MALTHPDTLECLDLLVFWWVGLESFNPPQPYP